MVLKQYNFSYRRSAWRLFLYDYSHLHFYDSSNLSPFPHLHHQGGSGKHQGGSGKHSTDWKLIYPINFELVYIKLVYIKLVYIKLVYIKLA